MSKKTTILLVTGLLSLLAFIVFRYYLTFKYAYFFFDICGDGFYNSYPALCGYADYIASHAIPSWSFKMGMGQSILPFTLRDPFDIIFYVAGSHSILKLTVYVEALKIVLSGVCFFYYLRLLNLSVYTSLIGCALFAFCGFATEGSAWLIFTFESFHFALFLLAFELLFTRRKWILFTITIFLFCISMPFNLYIYGLFMFSYAIFRHLQTGKFNPRTLAALFAKMAGCGLLGMLLAGPLFLQNALLLIHSPRAALAGSFNNGLSGVPMFAITDNFQLGCAIFRFFSNDIMGSGSNYKGWGDILSAPMVYCGLLCLLLLPQVFISLSRRSKILFSVFLSIWLLPMIFPYFRYAFWLFSGDYYRAYGFIVAFVILFYSLHALESLFQKRKVNYPILVITLLALLSFLFFQPLIDNKILDVVIRYFVAVTLIAYFVVLVLVPGAKNPYILKTVLFIFVLIEICIAGDVTANRKDAFPLKWLRDEKVMYNSYSKDAVAMLKQKDHSFYRIDKNYDPPTARYTDLNCSQYQGYNSTASYNSFNELHYITYLQTMGVADRNKEGDSRWSVGLLNEPILESENNVKYFISVKGFHPVWLQQWDSIATAGDVTVYENKYVLPFGHTYNRFITEHNFHLASSAQRRFITMSAVVINDKDINSIKGFTEYPLADTTKDTLSFELFKKLYAQKGTDSMAISRFEETKISGSITLSEDKMVYVSIPYDDGWHASIDGNKVNKIMVNGGMTGLLVTRGKHTIDLYYGMPLLWEGTLMSLAGVIILIVLITRNRKQTQNP